MQEKLVAIFKIISNKSISIDPKLVKTAITNSCSGNIAKVFVTPERLPSCQMILLNGAVL